MPKRFEGGISIRYKSRIRASRARGEGMHRGARDKEMANKIDRRNL
jgi:hypothetical protein